MKLYVRKSYDIVRELISGSGHGCRRRLKSNPHAWNIMDESGPSCGLDE
jgi:hypothetical protein